MLLFLGVTAPFNRGYTNWPSLHAKCRGSEVWPNVQDLRSLSVFVFSKNKISCGLAPSRVQIPPSAINMKVYEYKNGKVTKKTFKEYLQNNKTNYRILKDLHVLFLSISLLSILLSVVISFSVIYVIFYNGPLLLSTFIDGIAVLFSIYLIILFWSKYKKDLMKLKSR